MVAPIELSLKVKGDKELKRAKQLIDQVEKAIGKLNKVKIAFSTSEAERSLDKLNAQLKLAEDVTKRFFGSNPIRSGIGAFAAATGEARKEVQALRVSLQGAKTDSERTGFALQALSGQFKIARLEGQAFARASKDFFKFEGAGSLEARLNEIADFPKTLAASAEALKELTFMQSMAIDGTDEFLAVNAALGKQLELNAGLLERAARAQKPFSAGMSMVPPGLQRPALPAAGQTSGTFSVSTLDQAVAAAGVQQATSENRVGFAAGAESIAMERAAAATQAAAVSSATFAANVKKAALNAGTLPNIFEALEESFKTVGKFSKTGDGLMGRLKNPLKGFGPRGKSIISSALIGGGFPLLFGGGPGASIGGGIGGGLGGAIGGGFGFAGGIVGTAIGQALDKAAEGANLFAVEATKASTSIGRLVEAFGLRGTGAASKFAFAETLGIGAAARQAAEGSLETIVGKDGLAKLEKLGQSSEDASNALDRFGAATTSFFAPLLTAVNQGVTGLFGGISPLEQQRRDQEALENLPVRGRGTAARRNRLTTRIAKTGATAEAKAQLDLEKKITEVTDARRQLAKDSARVEGIKLTARRDSLAFEQGTLKVQEEQNKLDVLAIQLGAKKNSLTRERRQELELEQDLAKQALKLAENARANAVIEAERAIARDISTNEQEILQTFQNIGSVQRTSLEITESAEEAFARSQIILKGESELRLKTLDLQREQALVEKNEEKVRDRINEKFDLLIRLEKQRTNLQLEQKRQADILRRNREQEIKDNRELLKLESERNAKLQIRSMNFERKAELSSAGLGFFGQSEDFKEQTLISRTAQLEAYNEQIGRLQQRIAGLRAEDADERVIRAQTFKLEDLEAVRDSYERLQPSIDAAAIAQARFTDAMAVTVPVTDSLFDSLIAVVEGTKTAEQAFADFLRSIASMLTDAAKKIIAQYIAIGIARLFAGMGGGQQLDIQGSNVTEVLRSGNLYDPANSVFARANGGPVGAGRPYLVGERGPELFVPGAQGNIVPNNAMGGANVTVNVDASGSSVQGDGPSAQQLGKAIGAAVQAELIKQKRPGGLLTR